MFHTQHIVDLDAPELQPYRTMRRQMDHRRSGIFVAEGDKVVQRLLASHFEVVSLLMPEQYLEELSPLLEKRPEDVAVFIAGKSLLETLTGYSLYQGLLAIGRVPRVLSEAEVLESMRRPGLLVAVDGVSSAENIGAIVRNCSAFEATALIVGETSSSPFLRRAVRSSMGTVFELPIIETEHLAGTLKHLQSRNIRCVAAHPHAEGHTLDRISWEEDCCVIFGSEGHGISPEILALANMSVAIPMAHHVDSLNVANAAAVFLYEINRQRGKL